MFIPWKCYWATEAINSTSSEDFSATRTKYLLTNADYWVLNAGRRRTDEYRVGQRLVNFFILRPRPLRI